MVWQMQIRSLLIASHRALYCYAQYHCSYILNEKLSRLLHTLGTLQNVHIFPLCNFLRHYMDGTLYGQNYDNYSLVNSSLNN